MLRAHLIKTSFLVSKNAVAAVVMLTIVKYTRSTNRYVKCLLVACLLSSCANLPPTTNGPIDWQNHQADVLSKTDWHLQGRLNIRNQQDSKTATINWQQTQQTFSINLSGAFGFGAVQINGNDSYVSIERGRDEPIIGSNLAEISQLYLGYDFPADELYYWIRGLPAPQSSAQTLLNEQHMLEHLTQEDNHQQQWQIEFDRYQESDGVFLPGRIRAERPPLRLTFLISRWQLDNI